MCFLGWVFSFHSSVNWVAWNNQQFFWISTIETNFSKFEVFSDLLRLNQTSLNLMVVTWNSAYFSHNLHWFDYSSLIWDLLATSMEEVVSRFPHIAEQIFEELDSDYFIQCKIISQSWKNFMEEMVFCYHNCSNVLWEKIVLVWGKKLRKKFANSRP